MGDSGAPAIRERTVRTLEGDCTVLCVVVATASKVVIVVNGMYPSALAHADAHLGDGDAGVWICSPDCAGGESARCDP